MFAYAAVEENLKAQQSAKTQLESALAATQQQMEQYGQQLQRAQRDIAQAQQQAADSHAEVQVALGKCQGLEADNNELRGRVDRTTGELEALQVKLMYVLVAVCPLCCCCAMVSNWSRYVSALIRMRVS